MGIDRRTFLRRSAIVGAAGIAGAGIGARADRAAADDTPRPNPLRTQLSFDGPRQSGITDPPGEQATLIALDAIAVNRSTLVEGVQALSSQGRRLMSGYSFALRDPDDVPPDSGTLGAKIEPDALTVTIAFGASLFDDRYGFAAKRPSGLTPMPRFPGDDIDDSRAHGDVLVSLNANRRDTVNHAMRELLRPVRGSLQVRWMLDGFLSANRGPTPHSSRRNLFGFRDGTANPTGAQREALVWRRDGSTFQVVRTIRQHVEFWDRVGLLEQEQMIGRYRDSGAPLGGTSEYEDPRFDLDPHGKRIPLDAHMRLANPRTRQTADQRILRRGFNYHRGVDVAGQLDDGLLFVAFNRSTQGQFEVVQNRLAGEPMTDYITPVGGGYFFVPRGARGSTDWVGSGLLSA